MENIRDTVLQVSNVLTLAFTLPWIRFPESIPHATSFAGSSKQPSTGARKWGVNAYQSWVAIKINPQIAVNVS